MFPTIVNTAAIFAGGLLGFLIRGRLKKEHTDVVMQGIALAVMIIGLASSLEKLINENANTLLIIISLATGGFIGTIINIDKRFRDFAGFIQRKSGKSQSEFSAGFVTGSILFCVGTMAVIGSIESGVSGNYEILFAKSMMDGISSIVLGATLGVGVIFSAISVFIYQGTITLLASLVAPHITQSMLAEISAVGGILVFAIGLNILNITKIKLADFIPAIFIPVIYHIIIIS